jgi:hypothetical protein
MESVSSTFVSELRQSPRGVWRSPTLLAGAILSLAPLVAPAACWSC